MAEFKLTGSGKKHVAVDEAGHASISSDEPVSINPALPVTDIRVNVLELVEVSLTHDGARRFFKASYADGGTVEVEIDSEQGHYHASGQNVLTTITDGSDKSHSVLSFEPTKRSVSKKTH